MERKSKPFAFPCQGGDYTAAETFTRFGTDCTYTVDCRGNQPFLAGFSSEAKGTVRAVLHGDWLTDLEASEFGNCTYVISKGMSFAEKRPFENRELHGIWIRSLHTPDGIFFYAETSRFPEKIPFEISGRTALLSESDNRTSFYAGESAAGGVSVTVTSDICSPGKALVVGITEKIGFTVSDGFSGKLRLYGAVSCEAEVTNGTAEAEVTVSRKGLVPIVAAAVDGNGKITGFSFFTPLTLSTVFETADFRINGTYVEYLRSMLLRRIGFSMPEEEPRGELVYPFSMWIRNYTGQTLSSFGFEEEAHQYLRLLDDILVRDGFLKQSYGLSLLTGSDDLGTMGNDGMGYYLWCWGKLMNRFPDRRPNLRAVDRCVRWLKFHTRWNGLIQDGTEPVDLFTSDATDGCLYTQGIVIAGLRVLSGAYRNAGGLSSDEESLVKNLEEYADRLITAVKFRFRDTGFFDEYSAADGAVKEGVFGIFDPALREWARVIWSNIDSKYLHAYSVLQPGALFGDPEAGVKGFDGLIENTLEKTVSERACDYDDRLIYVHFPRVDAYSQLGTVLDLLFMNQPDRAFRYLDAFVSYWGLTKLTYILPECIETRTVGKPNSITYMRDTMKEKSESYPFLYPGSDGQPENGYFRAPGNLIHVGYLFWIYDVIAGISVAADRLVLTPRIPEKLFPVKISGYHTPFGDVDMETVMSDGKITAVYTVHSADGDMTVRADNLKEETINLRRQNQ